MAGRVIKFGKGSLGKAAPALAKQPPPWTPHVNTVTNPGGQPPPPAPPPQPDLWGQVLAQAQNPPPPIQVSKGNGGLFGQLVGTVDPAAASSPQFSGGGYNQLYPYGDPGTSGFMGSGEARAMLGGGPAGANELSAYELGYGSQQQLWDEQNGLNNAQNLAQLGANYAQGMGKLSNQYSRLGNELGATGMAFAGMGNPFAQNAGVGGGLGAAPAAGPLPPSPWQNPGAYAGPSFQGGGAPKPQGPGQNTSNQTPSTPPVQPVGFKGALAGENLDTHPILTADLDLGGSRTYADMQVAGGAQNAAMQQAPQTQAFTFPKPAPATNPAAPQTPQAPQTVGFNVPKGAAPGLQQTAQGATSGNTGAPTTAPAGPPPSSYVQTPPVMQEGLRAAQGLGQATQGAQMGTGFPGAGQPQGQGGAPGITSPVPAWMQIAQNGGGAYNFGANAAQANAGQEGAALGNLASAASGAQPSAAALQMAQGTDQAIAAQMAMANSTRGSLGLAEAQRNALQQGAQMQQTNVQNTGILRAQEMEQARQAYLQGTLGIGGQAISQQQLGQNAQLAAMQGATGAQEFGLNYGMQGELAGLGGALGAYGEAARTQVGATQAGQAQQAGWEGLGQNAMQGAQGLSLNAQQSQLQAEIANEQTAAGLAATNAGLTQGYIGAGASALGALGSAAITAAPAAAAVADADLVEPGGGAHWTLREEPGFLLAKDQMSGEMGKVHLDPLTGAERRRAQAPHGAGPLGANDPHRQRTTFSDMPVGRMPMWQDADLQDAMDNADPNMSPPPLRPEAPVTAQQSTGYLPMYRGQGWDQRVAPSDYNYVKTPTPLNLEAGQESRDYYARQRRKPRPLTDAELELLASGRF